MTTHFKLDKIGRQEVLITVTGDDILDPINIQCTLHEAIGLMWKIKEAAGGTVEDKK